MIKNIILAVLLFSITSSSFAGGLEVGAKGGLNFANIYDGADRWKTGLCVGGFVTLGINNVFAIQPEFLYTQKGSKRWEMFLGRASTRILNYLEIPVFLKLTEPTQGMFKPYLLVGPYLAYNLTTDEDIKDFDYGFAIGGGFDLVMPVGKIVFDGRYVIGLKPFKEDSDIKNRVISFMLGYSISL